MSDLDVLVPPARLSDALGVLGTAGWTPVHRTAEELGGPYLQQTYSHHLHHTGGQNLDLHQHVMFHEVGRESDEDFWKAAIPVEFEGIKSLALCPADQLLHVCLHGSYWNETPPIRWVADAWLVLEHGSVDWTRFLAQTQRREIALAMRGTMRYLFDRLHAPIPSSVLDALEGLPVSRAQVRRYQLETQPPGRHNTVAKLWYHYDRYRRFSQVYGSENPALRFPAYLRDIWNLRRTREVPLYIARFTWKRLARGRPVSGATHSGSEPSSLS